MFSCLIVVRCRVGHFFFFKGSLVFSNLFRARNRGTRSWHLVYQSKNHKYDFMHKRTSLELGPKLRYILGRCQAPKKAQPNGWPSFILLDILKEFIKKISKHSKARKPNSRTINRQTKHDITSIFRSKKESHLESDIPTTNIGCNSNLEHILYEEQINMEQLIGA